MKQAPVRHRLEYALFLGLRGVLRSLPHAAARACGSFLGRLAHRLDRRHREVALRNLELAFPELPHAARRRLAARCFRHFGGALCDLISADRFDPVEVCRRFSFTGWEHLDAAERLGKGVFLLGAHHGYWEISGRPIGLYRGTLHTIARPADNPYLERELSRLRTRHGYAVIHKRGAARRMLQVLRDGGRVGILPDQRVRPHEGILVPFFGRPALTTPILARLSLRSGAPVVPVFAYPEPRGRYRIVIRPPILPADLAPAPTAPAPPTLSTPPTPPTPLISADELPADSSAQSRAESPADSSADFPAESPELVAALTRRYIEVIEREIRDRPHMWLWMHRRWDPRQPAVPPVRAG
jgi:KDO2-lipid IV(A) lauroyltransferase